MGCCAKCRRKAGANVDLTIDARIQMIVEEALRAVGRGAAVVVDPNNGDILAMATVPSFNPNTFIPSIKAKDWEELRKAPADPLINRAVSAFPPGSTYKLVTALAGLSKGLGNARYDCGGGVGYGDHFFRCHIADKGGTHGQLGLSDAIKVSCNSYFYQMGNAAGINAIDQIGEALGLGKATGVEVTGEQPGVLPGPDWMRIYYPRERWTSAYTANVSIGQGYVLVSPLQMAMVYSALANGGIAYQPRLVKSVVGADGKPILNEKGQPVVSPNPKVRRDLRFDVGAAQIEQARRALFSVVNEGGTGGRARLPNVAVAGKTGSAQAMTDGKSDTIAWFACFAPYNAPKYVVAVMVQGGKGGGAVAAPIANRILGRIFAMEEAKFDPAAGLARAGPKAKSLPVSRIGRFQGFGPDWAVGRRNKSERRPKRRFTAGSDWPRSRCGTGSGCGGSRGRSEARSRRSRRRPRPRGNPISSKDFLVYGPSRRHHPPTSRAPPAEPQINLVIGT